MTQKTLLQKNDLKGIVYLRYGNSNISQHINIAINKFGLCANEQTNDFLNFDTASDKFKNSELLFQFFPQLSFSDIYKILETSQSFRENELFDKDDLFKKFQIPNSDKVYSVMKEASQSWGKETLDWIQEKKIRPQEILFLLNLTVQERIRLLNAIAMSSLSKSQALQFLEWTSDLILLKINLPEELFSSINEKTLESIKELRFPKSFLQHPLQNKKISWGQGAHGVQGQFIRKQDRAGFQVQFFVSTSEELEKVIQQLQKNQSEWNQQ